MNRLFSNPMINSVLESVTLPVRHWFDEHPLMNWFVSHPLWLLSTVLVVILLLAGLIGAIGRLTENIWLAVLRSPFHMGRWIWNLGLKLLQKSSKPESQIITESTTPQQRLVELLNRLEALKQEQDTVLQEVRTLLLSQ